MKRSTFLQNLTGLGIASLWGCNTGTANSDIARLRQELTVAWERSEKMTLGNVAQMPPELFTFKYTDEAMTFSEQWRHCVIYTCGQLAGRTGIENPYENVKLPIQMPKEDVIRELKNMYAFVCASVQELSDTDLQTDCDFAGGAIPVWRLFYALENHIIHHRGQCVVYLRLNGVVPKGYYGW